MNRALSLVTRHGVPARLPGRRWAERLQLLRTYVREDPTVTYDLHAAFSKDPDNVKLEDALDSYTKIQQAAIRAGKRPPKKKKPKLDAVGTHVGIRVINQDVPLRIRERLIAEGMEMEPQFFVGRYGLNKELVKLIRSAFRHFEILRIEVGSPWTDNTAKFAERLEYRTGAIVLDKAGSRVLLYRGFTHADLARTGLLDPSCFTVGNEYKIPRKSRTEFQQQLGNVSPRRKTMKSVRSREALPNSTSAASKKPWHSKKNQQMRTITREAVRVSEEQRKSDTADDLDDDREWVSSELYGDEIEELTFEMPKSDVIDVDEVPETILNDSGEEEEEKIKELVASVQYNAIRLKGAVPKTDIPF